MDSRFLSVNVVLEASALLSRLDAGRSDVDITRLEIACKEFVSECLRSGRITSNEAERLYTIFDAAVAVKAKALVGISRESGSVNHRRPGAGLYR